MINDKNFYDQAIDSDMTPFNDNILIFDYTFW